MWLSFMRKMVMRLLRRIKRNSVIGAVKKFLNRLFKKHRIRLSNILVNKFRISRMLVPVGELQQKYREALLYLTAKKNTDKLGDYLEFGVYQGTSLLCMDRALKNLGLCHTRLFGFDSFEGLPLSADADASKLWCQGQFRADYEFTEEVLTKAGVDWDRVFLVKGFFESTLNKKIIKKHNIARASVIMIDCDMYLSAKEALDFCASLIHNEAMIFFDDWHCTSHDGGEKKAFAEFLRENSHFAAEEFGTYCSNAQVFRVFRKEKVNGKE